MSNSFITSLTPLSNPGSVSFFVSNNDNPRLVSAEGLSHALGCPLTTIVHRNGDIGYANATNTLVPFNATSQDPLGIFDSNSVGNLFINFDGWVEVTAQLGTQAAAGTDHFGVVLKNGSTANLGAGVRFYNDWNEEYQAYTIPFTVTSGDTISLQLYDSGTLSIDGDNQRTWLEVKPLAFY